MAWRRRFHRRLQLALILGVVNQAALALPSFAEVRRDYRESEAWLLDRQGQPLQQLRTDHQGRRLPWVPLADISPIMVRALLLSEDRRFYEHSGVDWGAAAASAWGNLWNDRSRGASTVTMQLTGLLADEDKRRGRRSLIEKVGQAASALRLERIWQKNEILEAYLNLAGFRGEMQGIGAMSRALFGKAPDGLEAAEAAIATALLRNPAASADTVTARACPLLRTLQPGATCDDLSTLARVAFAGGLRDGWNATGPAPDLAPHLARKLLDQPGQRLTTTLDADLQRFAAATVQRHLRELARQNVQDGAVIVIDNATGEVLAWVGSSGGLSTAPAVDAVVALRQAGSTLKPFLYGLAFDRRMLTPASLLDDSPASIPTATGLYVPQDYAPEFRGWVSVRQALAGSLNVPAVRALVRVGADPFFDRLQAFGLRSLKENGDYYGYSLALGSADVSPLMLANAYRTLANGGNWSPLRVTRDGARLPCREGGCRGVFTDREHRAASAQSSFLVADILSDRAARAATFGLESWLATPYWSAAKTGTSKDMRDNWCAGFTRRHTVVAWVGNAGGEAMHDVSGTAGAAPVWREITDWLERGRVGTGHRGKPPAPTGLASRAIRFEPPSEPPRQEWFLAGTETSVVRRAGATALARIAYPAEGTVIALDPDIPPDRQRIALLLSGRGEIGWRWRVDDAPPVAVNGRALWRPSPGHHRLALLEKTGQVIDAVHFEVRALRGTPGR